MGGVVSFALRGLIGVRCGLRGLLPVTAEARGEKRAELAFPGCPKPGRAGERVIPAGEGNLPPPDVRSANPPADPGQRPLVPDGDVEEAADMDADRFAGADDGSQRKGANLPLEEGKVSLEQLRFLVGWQLAPDRASRLLNQVEVAGGAVSEACAEAFDDPRQRLEPGSRLRTAVNPAGAP